MYINQCRRRSCTGWTLSLSVMSHVCWRMLTYVGQGSLSRLIGWWYYQNQFFWLVFACITDVDNQGEVPKGSIIDRDNQTSFILIITDNQAFSPLLSQPFQVCTWFTGPNRWTKKLEISKCFQDMPWKRGDQGGRDAQKWGPPASSPDAVGANKKTSSPRTSDRSHKTKTTNLNLTQRKTVERVEKVSTLHLLSEGKWFENIHFSYGLTTLVREKFIGSYSLKLRQMVAKSYHSVVRNKA